LVFVVGLFCCFFFFWCLCTGGEGTTMQEPGNKGVGRGPSARQGRGGHPTGGMRRVSSRAETLADQKSTYEGPGAARCRQLSARTPGSKPHNLPVTVAIQPVNNGRHHNWSCTNGGRTGHVGPFFWGGDRHWPNISTGVVHLGHWDGSLLLAKNVPFVKWIGRPPPAPGRLPADGPASRPRAN